MSHDQKPLSYRPPPVLSFLGFYTRNLTVQARRRSWAGASSFAKMRAQPLPISSLSDLRRSKGP